LNAGADVTLDDYRLGKHMAVLYQVIYVLKLESLTRVYSEKICLSEHVYLPIIEKHELTQTEDIKDQYLIHSVNIRDEEGTFIDGTPKFVMR
jgi:hypothetical protein